MLSGSRLHGGLSRHSHGRLSQRGAGDGRATRRGRRAHLRRERVPRHGLCRGIDGHKYAFEKRAIVYGEEGLVIGLTAFLTEIGVTPVLCASGGKSGCFEKCLREAAPDLPATTLVKEGFDFAEIAEAAPGLTPDLLLGNSKGYSLARKLNIPLSRVGFPIHDRIGGQRIHHLGFCGAQELFDRIVNALMESKQGNFSIGYSYLW